MLKVNDPVVQFDFLFESIHGKVMQVFVCYRNQCWVVQSTKNKEVYHGRIEIPIRLPGTIRLEFSGKNQSTDTLVDTEGRIVKDLCVKIKSIRLDGLLVDQGYINDHLRLVTQTQDMCIGPYVGFNGSMTIELTKDNVFSQINEFSRLSRQQLPMCS